MPSERSPFKSPVEPISPPPKPADLSGLGWRRRVPPPGPKDVFRCPFIAISALRRRPHIGRGLAKGRSRGKFYPVHGLPGVTAAGGGVWARRNSFVRKPEIPRRRGPRLRHRRAPNRPSARHGNPRPSGPQARPRAAAKRQFAHADEMFAAAIDQRRHGRAVDDVDSPARQRIAWLGEIDHRGAQRHPAREPGLYRVTIRRGDVERLARNLPARVSGDQRLQLGSPSWPRNPGARPRSAADEGDRLRPKPRAQPSRTRPPPRDGP